MTRDPLYQQILTALAGDLDDSAFEACAADLLRDAYPTLVPIRGGDDGGFDGAIGTPQGAFPLLSTTTRRGILGNLRRNLGQYVAKQPDGPKLAVIATPRAVTPRKRRNADSAASKEFGIRIVNIHDQTDFANRLYRNAAWRLELLGLSGRPEALSALPPRSRPERPLLVGREPDLQWLRNTDGDLLLVGQPGIGKTYLHEVLVHEGIALFAVDKDPERLANALRAQRPKVVVVDDAQSSLDLVHTLLRLRVELGASFYIHANCWPHGEQPVKSALELPVARVRHVDLLTREQMVTVIKELGVHGPDRLLHLLLEQAEGKPGLAAALVAAVRRGDLREVWSGEALAESLLHGRQLLRDGTELPVLASFALGGGRGVSLSEVAEFLGSGTLHLQHTVLNLAAGGVVHEVAGSHGRRLAIRPPVLRGVLVRDAFYRGPATLDADLLIRRLRSDRSRIEGLAKSLLAARQRGAEIDDEVLMDIVIESDSSSVWRHAGYVSGLGKLILTCQPEAVHRAAEGLLQEEPEATLPHLLRASEISAKASRNGREVLKEWLEGDEPGDAESIPRRRQLLATMKRTSADDGENDEHWALAAAISPVVDTHRIRPGDGTTVVVYRGLRPLRQLKDIAAMWPDVLFLCRNARRLSPEFRGAIHAWCFPELNNGERAVEEIFEFCERQAAQLLVDLQTLRACGRACRSWIREIASRAGLVAPVQVDRTFHRIFGTHGVSSDYETRQRRREIVLRHVADQLSVEGASNALALLSSMEREVADFGWHGGHDRSYLYDRLAHTSSDILEWFDAALRERISALHLSPFLHVALQRARADLEERLSTILLSDGYDEYRQLVCLAVLSMPDAKSELLGDALAALKVHGHGSVFEFARMKPCIKTARMLLRHSDRQVRVCAAMAEWLAEPRGLVRDDLRQDWRAAILDARDEYDYLLAQILETEAELSYEWAIKKIDEANSTDAFRFELWRLSALFEAISAKLDREDRWRILERIDL